MNTNRTAVIGGTAALLLVLTGCAGVDGQFDDGARAESAQQRVAAHQAQLSPEQVAQAIESYERLREAKNAEFQAQAAERAQQAAAVYERIREVKASESTPVSVDVGTSVRELVREAKQAESSPVTTDASTIVQEHIREALEAHSESSRESQEPMTPEQVREFKASQVQ